MKKILLLSIFIISSFAYNVTVSILPQKFVVDKIAKDKAQVNVMVLPGMSPATYSPKPAQLLSLKKSIIYFKIGVPFEKAWLDKFKSINPNIKIVDFGKYVKKDKNPHIWLDPLFLINEARVVKESLIKIDSKNKKFYEKNYKEFVKEALDIDDKIRNKLSNLKNRKFLIFHPNLYYFAKEYNLVEIPLEKEGKEPSFQYLLRIIKIAKQNNIKTIFTAPEFSHKEANFLATKIGAKVVEFSALKYNIFDNLLRVAKILNDNN